MYERYMYVIFSGELVTFDSSSAYSALPRLNSKFLQLFSNLSKLSYSRVNFRYNGSESIQCWQEHQSVAVIIESRDCISGVPIPLNPPAALNNPVSNLIRDTDFKIIINTGVLRAAPCVAVFKSLSTLVGVMQCLVENHS